MLARKAAGQVRRAESLRGFDLGCFQALAGCCCLAAITKGKPIREAIVPMGPFVINTQAEIQQAIRGYQHEKQQGKFGELSL
ncbi:hypothetical protein JYB85_15180 [Shewanella sedimentimangrovi]|uniref:Pirin C-terminal domain-containing protein n=1 Tax=Shewanella sedimentimangrovi TaxID=2814293 RepID=A0ABX7R5K1_9GAMM|nr:hypothetical protein JYB85_15180 [Shewanella sedimentimangrovi]